MPGGSASASARRGNWISCALLGCLLVPLLWVSEPWAEDPGPGEVEVSTPFYKVEGGVDQPAERWDFSFEWTGIPVGWLYVETAEATDARGPGLEVRIKASTNKVVDLLWRYRLDAKGLIRTDPFGPGEFIIDEYERKKHKFTSIRFPDRHRIESLRRKGDSVKEFSFAADNTFDILSSVFLILNLDYVVGDQLYIDTFTGTKRYLVTVDVEGLETLRVAGEEVKGWRLRADTTELTKPDGDGKHKETRIWVSEQRPRRLLKASSKTFVGAINVELARVSPVGQEDEGPAGAPRDAGAAEENSGVGS
ncbi:MAG: DUF3108 domain-containing protein [Candidatus Binatia bacterium]